jgi:hypothetical protein
LDLACRIALRMQDEVDPLVGVVEPSALEVRGGFDLGDALGDHLTGMAGADEEQQRSLGVAPDEVGRVWPVLAVGSGLGAWVGPRGGGSGGGLAC